MNALPPACDRGLGLLLGYAGDRLLGDPVRYHPVAGFGTVAAAAQGVLYRDSRVAGTAYALGLIGGAAFAGALGDVALRRLGRPAHIGGVAVATWAVLGGTTLTRTGAEMAARLDRSDLDAARALLPSLCGRDPELLDAAGLARAALESVAENTSDAAVAPLLWGAVAGLPGLLAYRAANTLDAMVGYRSPRYRHFGWAAARIDDVANYVPARLTALTSAVCAPAVGGRPAAALRAWRRDAGNHPSPNAGVVEAASAGALGVSLGGLTVYRHGAENRPTLGAGPAPDARALERGARLSRLTQAGAAGLSALLAVAVGQARLSGVARRARLGRA